MSTCFRESEWARWSVGLQTRCGSEDRAVSADPWTCGHNGNPWEGSEPRRYTAECTHRLYSHWFISLRAYRLILLLRCPPLAVCWPMQTRCCINRMRWCQVSQRVNEPEREKGFLSPAILVRVKKRKCNLLVAVIEETDWQVPLQGEWRPSGRCPRQSPTRQWKPEKMWS